MFQAMTLSEKKSWEQMQDLGRPRFILQKGLLRDGLLFGTVTTCGPLLYDFLSHKGTITSPWDELIGFIIMTLVVGYVSGEMRWRKGEAEYKEPIEVHSES